MYFIESEAHNLWLPTVVQLILSFLVARFIYPGLIYLGHLKKLSVSPIGRSAHAKSTSILGGVGLFFTFFIAAIGAFLGYGNIDAPLVFLALMCSLLVMFFLGLKDDIVGVSPLGKVLVQLTVALFFMFFSGDLINDFGTLFGLRLLPGGVSWALTLFVYVLGVNAYNLIDGIDGLAGSIAATVLFYFGVAFAGMGDYQWTFICFGALGSILGFLRFNMFGNRRIFMGDSGSMFIGFLLVAVALHYLNVPRPVDGSVLGKSILLVLALFSYPLVDVLRIFIVRIKNGCSPFHADKNHLHHFMLRLGLNHKRSTGVVVAYTILLTLMVHTLDMVNVHVTLLLLVLVNMLIALLPSIIRRKGDRIVVRIAGFNEA